MDKKFISLIVEIVVIPLALANLLNATYLQTQTNSAVAASESGLGEMIQSQGNKCEGPKTPPAGN
ncbi:hypothetical protein [Laspinema olomoucense]|uniref:Uncharacterized protein n=1 Tax=Laspinema olomoucense D3b TaxID=2953688 RepID=A0ABT2NAE3_9CYAN|nr:hypothetical protein [Laspinema sp. D3b]MCT7979672.1 hypothetical protein [Laspinema sp. D3b]